jgi:hypothetical protein
MINIFLIIIIIIIITLVYYYYKLENIKTQKEIEYNKLYNKYIPYHINGSFNSNEDKKVELFRVLNENMKIYDYLYNNEKDITKQKEYLKYKNILSDLYLDMQFRELYKNPKNYDSLC